MIKNANVMPPTIYPCCGYTADRTATIDCSIATPNKGDFTLCINCGAILEFTNPPDVAIISEVRINEFKFIDPKAWSQIERAQLLIRALPKRPGTSNPG